MLYLPVLSRVAYGKHSPRKWYRGDSILVKGIASPVSPLIAVLSRSDLVQLLAHLARSRMASAMLYAHEAMASSPPSRLYSLTTAQSVCDTPMLTGSAKRRSKNCPITCGLQDVSISARTRYTLIDLV